MPEFSHISGDRMLDLINTVEWRLGGPEREEDLTSYPVVLTWCREADLLDAEQQTRLSHLAGRDPRRAAAELQGVIELREHAYAALFDADEAAAASIAAAYREAVAQAHLARSGSGWAWRDTTLTLETPRHRIARGLVELLGRDDLDRLHQCEDALCGWVYLDTSPRRNRRWCVTSDCGDRNRSRAYYARQQARRRSTQATARQD
ncbi:CGNR zinc finger domain-containing protein [Arsenicicoccus sp. oral taxon 190]|uniref:CGNR zinc finger domain-containing protein n=1 Tax=Arsenicicoccus sp. oral taxon 190 TaxID=1658671 RepID=UPI000679FEF9|nr:CGNR zinc finger domain-containing protein [Arsenicicoccus sp. oral taxon 190]AKT52450.1 hypothetical protein ADJ73_16350 [Arsenicicoccus sp. oral taxon 190]